MSRHLLHQQLNLIRMSFTWGLIHVRVTLNLPLAWVFICSLLFLFVFEFLGIHVKGSLNGFLRKSTDSGSTLTCEDSIFDYPELFSVIETVICCRNFSTCTHVLLQNNTHVNSSFGKMSRLAKRAMRGNRRSWWSTKTLTGVRLASQLWFMNLAAFP